MSYTVVNKISSCSFLNIIQIKTLPSIHHGYSTKVCISEKISVQQVTDFQTYQPIIWSVLFPTMFSASLSRPGPKHSTSVPFSSEVAVPLSVDEKEVALVPNPVPVVTVKALADPQVRGAIVALCSSGHSVLPFTLQMVSPFMSPVTVHLKVNISPGQVGGAAVSCPAT